MITKYIVRILSVTMMSHSCMANHAHAICKLSMTSQNPCFLIVGPLPTGPNSRTSVKSNDFIYN